MIKAKFVKLALAGLIIVSSCTKNTTDPLPETGTGGGTGNGSGGTNPGDKYPVLTTRDKLIWPFASNSIWNTSIGANAKYVNLGATLRTISEDIDFFIVCKASDPAVPTYLTGSFYEGRCNSTQAQPQGQYHPELLQPMKIPSNLVIADAITSGGQYSTPNNSSAFLAPDGKTLDQLNVTSRCTAGGPLYGYRTTQQDIYGDGIEGAHLGSALSSIGGSLRTGELTGTAAIRHALKIDIYGDYMYYDKKTGSGHRWPAELNDGAAPNSYKGSNPALVMGSLLAIPPSVDIATLNLKTNAAR